MKKKNILIDLAMLLLFVVGIGALAYPFVSDSVNHFVDQQIINFYQERANQENQEEMNRIHAEMEAKNREIAEQGAPGTDPYAEIDFDEEVETQPVSFYDEHTIGVVTIPKINVRLPIFDSTLPVFLEKGASLLEGTSYPTGGESTHSVITSHAGLTQAKLFTDLGQLEEGDQYFIEINGRTLAYEVNQIKVVLPTETDDLKIVEGEDFTTLLTCTPYMVNTHRLLVRGHRIPYVPEVVEQVDKVVEAQNNQIFLMVSLIVGATLFVIWLFYRIIANYRISQRTYPLSMTVLDESGRPAANVPLQVMNARGAKPIVDANGEHLVLTTDQTGEIKEESLPGGKYTLVNEERNMKFKLSITKVKQEGFKVKPQADDAAWRRYYSR